MAEILQRSSKLGLSRRGFLGACAAACGAIALNGCTPSSVTPTDVPEEVVKTGVWKTIACAEACGGKCLNRAYFVDGIAIRQKTDDTHPDSPEYPQMRGCARGRAQRNGVFATDRLKYPMKRKHWAPGGGKNINGALRGNDEWERISWNQAIDYIIEETKRIEETYGKGSVFAYGGHASSNWLSKLGGWSQWSMATVSYGTWVYTPGIIGTEPGAEVVANWGWYGEFLSRDQTNDRFDAANAELVVLWGMNNANSASGNCVYNFQQIKKAGARFIHIDPHYNDTALALEAEWMPVRPGTDIALMIATAYVMLQDDTEANPLIDWDFLNRCTIGFDAEHMPEGADPKDNFKDYCLGTYDGMPKTPEWASEICGVSPERIRQFAHEIGMQTKVALYTSWGPARTDNADHWPQMFMTLGAMGGHFGKSGHMCGCRTTHQAATPGLSPLGTGLGQLIAPGWAGFNMAFASPVALSRQGFFEACCKKQATIGGDGAGNAVTNPMDIRMYYSCGSCILSTNQDVNQGIEAFRNLDFVLVQDIKFTFTARYADIVLPVKSAWEQYVIPWSDAVGREVFFAWQPVVEGYYEAKSDKEIDQAICEKMGYSLEEGIGVTEKQGSFNVVAGTQILDEQTLEYQPLVTITQEDIDDFGVEGTPQEGRVAFKDFIDKGMYQLETKPGDNYSYIAFEKFRKDPEANPTPSSASGKFEIYSKTLADTINGIGFDTIKPYPEYKVPVDGYEASFSDWKNKIPGDYPFQAISIHYIRRAHSTFDTIYELREAFQNPVFINADDAAAKGIKQGDTVIVYNQTGKVLRMANCTERVMPGCVVLPHAPYGDMDEVEGVDRGGNENVLNRIKYSGAAIDAYNSCLVNYEKYTGEPLVPDVEKPRIVVDELIS